MKEKRVKKGLKSVNILSIKVNSTNTEEVLSVISRKLAENRKFYIVTPNPEIILQAQNDPLLAQILNKADISIADGVGLKLGKPNLNIIKGRNLLVRLLEMANALSLKVFFLGNKNYIKALAKTKLKYPHLKVLGAEGPALSNEAEPVSQVDSLRQKDVVKKINDFKPDLLFVGFGAPKQEKWIFKWLTKLDVKGAMVVGGAIDYLGEVVSLPPKWLENLGLEWFWRLIKEPQRLGRIFKAVVVFPILVFVANFKKPLD